MYLQSWTSDICWDLNFTNHINFQPLEVVCRGSETQLQVAENLNGIAEELHGLTLQVVNEEMTIPTYSKLL